MYFRIEQMLQSASWGMEAVTTCAQWGLRAGSSAAVRRAGSWARTRGAAWVRLGLLFSEYTQGSDHRHLYLFISLHISKGFWEHTMLFNVRFMQKKYILCKNENKILLNPFRIHNLQPDKDYQCIILWTFIAAVLQIITVKSWKGLNGYN